jgi:hydroxymethylpyrimidine/phosphomethylpyrimidine kinase
MAQPQTPDPRPQTPAPFVALTIAGSDSGGGAGIQADIKAMEANGVFAASVITAITAQNTQAVTQSAEVPLELIEAQIDAVFSDIRVHVVKTGMLSSGPIIELVARKVKQWKMRPLVVDPVMISTTGYKLLQDEAIELLIERLLPLATLVTPNTHEAGLMIGSTVQTVDEAKNAAWDIKRMGAAAVLVKGGHLKGEAEAIDVFYDGKSFAYFRAPFIATPHTHGTGCTYASAIAANLAKGYALQAAIGRAKRYVTEAIRHGLAIGQGSGPTNPFYFLPEPPELD